MSRRSLTLLRSPVKVIYIVGFPRSGSTLLERLLGEEAAVFSGGEIRRIWERGFIENQLCSCGEPFHDCPFWTAVVAEAFAGPDGVDATAMAAGIAALEQRRERWQEVSRRLVRTGGAPDPLDSVLLALYRAIRAVAGVPAIVDSSKDAAYGLMLSRIQGVDVEIVHLVRDSRAVSYSWRRKRRRPEIVDREEFMPLIRPRGAAVGWNMRNVSAEALRWVSPRYTRLRYEDLTADPPRVLARILGPHQGAAATASAMGAAYHTVSGNPLRLDRRPLMVREDIEWISAMEDRDRRTVTALTFPMLLRYGYPLSPDGLTQEIDS